MNYIIQINAEAATLVAQADATATAVSLMVDSNQQAHWAPYNTSGMSALATSDHSFGQLLVWALNNKWS
jgi:hypothetical protein